MPVWPWWCPAAHRIGADSIDADRGVRAAGRSPAVAGSRACRAGRRSTRAGAGGGRLRLPLRGADVARVRRAVDCVWRGQVPPRRCSTSWPRLAVRHGVDRGGGRRRSTPRARWWRSTRPSARRRHARRRPCSSSPGPNSVSASSPACRGRLRRVRRGSWPKRSGCRPGGRGWSELLGQRRGCLRLPCLDYLAEGRIERGSPRRGGQRTSRRTVSPNRMMARSAGWLPRSRWMRSVPFGVPGAWRWPPGRSPPPGGRPTWRSAPWERHPASSSRPATTSCGSFPDAGRARRRAPGRTTLVEQLRLTPMMFEFGARPPARAISLVSRAVGRVRRHLLAALRVGRARHGHLGLADELLLSDGMPRLIYVRRPAPDIEPGLEAMLGRLEDGRPCVLPAVPVGDRPSCTGLLLDDLAVLLSERFVDTRRRRIVDRRRPAATYRRHVTDVPRPRRRPSRELTALVADRHRPTRHAHRTRRDRQDPPCRRAATGAFDRFADGLYFVDLTRSVRSDEVFATIARVVGCGSATREGSALDALNGELRDLECCSSSTTSSRSCGRSGSCHCSPLPAPEGTRHQPGRAARTR